MAITSSAKKAHRASLRKRVFNMRRKEKMLNLVKETKRFAASGKSKEARISLSQAYEAIDKAAKVHYITKNTAARKKSRLAVLLNKTTVK